MPYKYQNILLRKSYYMIGIWNVIISQLFKKYELSLAISCWMKFFLDIIFIPHRYLIE